MHEFLAGGVMGRGTRRGSSDAKAERKSGWWQPRRTRRGFTTRLPEGVST